jgi:hypothetical protein
VKHIGKIEKIKWKPKKGEKEKIKMTTIQNNVIDTLKNGVQVMDVYLDNDFSEAQRIADISSIMCDIDVEYAYKSRMGFMGLGTYKVMVSRTDDYDRFFNKMEKENREHTRAIEREINLKRDKVMTFWRRGLYSRDEAVNALDVKFNYQPCECKKCSFVKNFRFDHWKTNKLDNGQKVGKVMRKLGFSSELMDFYSLQTKTEKEMFITVSDTVQHIIGMSYYSNLKWDGYNDSSCQDVRWDYSPSDTEGVIQLAGSLHDSKLFIAFLHERLEDLEDMNEKMLARSIMRYVTVDNKASLVATTYYGNNDTKDMLHNALNSLSEVDVYSKDVRQSGDDWHKEDTNGFFTMHKTDDVYVCYTVDTHVDVDCPTCDGSGSEYNYDAGETIECCTCNGRGEVEAHVYKEVEEYKEVEKELTIEPYAEGYTHYGSYISIRLDKDMIRLARQSFKDNE